MFKYYLNHTNTSFGDMVKTEVKEKPKKKKSHWKDGEIPLKFIAHSARFLSKNKSETNKETPDIVVDRASSVVNSVSGSPAKKSSSKDAVKKMPKNKSPSKQ